MRCFSVIVIIDTIDDGIVIVVDIVVDDTVLLLYC